MKAKKHKTKKSKNAKATSFLIYLFFFQSGYKTYAGTTFLGDRDGVKYYDATVVAKLRSLGTKKNQTKETRRKKGRYLSIFFSSINCFFLGAIVVGKTNMYEVCLFAFFLFHSFFSFF